MHSSQSRVITRSSVTLASDGTILEHQPVLPQASTYPNGFQLSFTGN